jgi:hypothetical protein
MAWTREYHVRLRKKALDILGGKCVDCGLEETEENSGLLDFDHIKRSSKKRKTESSSETFRRVVYRGATACKIIQLLCPNCHRLKTIRESEFVNGKIIEEKNSSNRANP